MQLVDAGLAFVSDAIGGLGGNATGALGQAGNFLPNALGGGNTQEQERSALDLISQRDANNIV